MIQFCCFNPMPWPNLRSRPESWPYPNSAFDPQAARQLYDLYLDQLVLAEECGFDWIGVGEDHMTAYSLTPNPALILSILARRTKRVRLALLGIPLPLLNPIRVAEECAMLDVLSGGRLVTGFIRGVPQNYAAYNVDPDESRDRFGEACELILKAWSERSVFAWRGRFYHFPKVAVWPLPVQQPHPTLVFSGNSAPSAVNAARRRAVVGSIHLYTRNALDMLKISFDAYRAQAEQDGWEATSDRFLVGLEACIADTDRQASDRFAPALDYRYRTSFRGLMIAKKRDISPN